MEFFNRQAAVEKVFAQLDSWPANNISARCQGWLTTDLSVQSYTLAEYGNSDSVYELASVTKILVTLTVLVALMEEVVTLDDAVEPPGATLRHLLSHASGLDTNTRKIIAPPGTRRIYSSSAFDIIAEYIAYQSQIPFSEYFIQGLCQPLGLKHTKLWGSAGFGARSSVDDLTLIMQELINPQYIPAELMQLTRTIQFPDLAGFVPGYGKHIPNPWCLGLEYHGHKYPHWLGVDQPPTIIGHFGQAGTFLWVDTLTQIGVVVLTDEPFGAWAKTRWSDFNNAIQTALRA